MKYRVGFSLRGPLSVPAGSLRRARSPARISTSSVFYLEAAAPDSPWPEKALPPYSQNPSRLLVSASAPPAAT